MSRFARNFILPVWHLCKKIPVSNFMKIRQMIAPMMLGHGPRTDGRTDVVSTHGVISFLLRKECLIMKGFPFSQYFLGKSTFSLGWKLCKLNELFLECCKFNKMSISSQLVQMFSNQYPDVFITVESPISLPTSPDVMIPLIKLALAQLHNVRTKSTFTFSFMNLK